MFVRTTTLIIISLMAITTMAVADGITSHVHNHSVIEHNGQTTSLCLAPPHPLKQDVADYFNTDGVSQRYGIRIDPHYGGVKSAVPVTGQIKVLAIRAEFQKEDPDDPLTTGDGTMDLTGSVPEKYWLDDAEGHPYPHDREYFNRYMKSMRNYYWETSNHLLNIVWDVAPFNDTLSYVLPQPMSYYGAPYGDGEDKARGLVEMFHDAIVAADADTSYLMQEYDAFMLIHAGAGWGTDVNGDTPGDIRSAFLTEFNLRIFLSNNDPDYEGIAVDDSTFFVKEGPIVPETANQDGYYFGLTGLFTHEFGHQLGLPDLYDTSGYSTGISSWDLMATGSWNDQGYFPAELGGWSKYFLGWVEPEVITENGDFDLNAIEIFGASDQLYKIPINSHEYFLIENRQQYVNDGRVFCSNCPPENPEEGTRAYGLINPMTGDTLTYYAEKEAVIWTTDYDFHLPGSGILIWHIDDNIISGNMLTNTVNYSLPKGVDVEEADGINDDLDPTFFGNAFYGSEYDFFYEGNNSEFTPFTLPSTHSNNGSDTHISITNISERAETMSFSVSFDWQQAGFPRDLYVPANLGSPNHGDIDGDGLEEIVVISDNGWVYAFNHDGTALPFFSDTGLIAHMDYTTSGSVAIYNLDNHGYPEILATTNDGQVFGWRATDENGDGLADLIPGFPLQANGRLSSPVIASHWEDGSLLIMASSSDGFLYAWMKYDGSNEYFTPPGFPVFCDTGLFGEPTVDDIDGDGAFDFIAVGSRSGQIYAFTPNGIPLEGFPVDLGHPISAGLINGDLDQPSWKDLIAVTEDGYVFALYHDGSIMDGYPVKLNGGIKATPALADLDADGFIEIIVPYGYYHVAVIAANGVLMSEWPQEFDQYTNHPPELLQASPIVADVDDDGDVEILLGTWDGNIHAWHHDGTKVDRFPLTAGGDIQITPMAFNLDDDPYTELVAVSDEGVVYAWEMPSESGHIPWGQFRYNASLTGEHSYHDLLPIVEGTEIMPDESVYVYPNPAKDTNPKFRYRLGTSAGVLITIYNAAGEIVNEIIGTRYVNMDNEVEWDVSGISSGIYFAHVMAQSGLTKTSKIVKVAVTK